jgi:nucleoside-diphosphate-sugar epimerase
MTRVLVTGGTGFIGRQVVASLTRRGHEVSAVSRGIAHTSTGATADEPPYRVDLLNEHDRQRLISEVRPEVMVHLAWTTTHGAFWTSLQNLDWVHASLELARLFIDGGGRRLVGLGTCAERSSKTSPKTRGTSPGSLYGAAKLSTATILQSLCEQASVSFAWPRVFFTFGPGEDRQRFVPQLVDSLAAGRVAIVRQPDLVRDFLPVEVLGETLSQVALSDLTGAFDVGSGVGVALGDLATQLAQIIGAEELLSLAKDPTPSSAPALVADLTPFREHFGTQPAADLGEWLARLVESGRDS